MCHKEILRGKHPLVGSPLFLTPRFILNLIFASRASKVVNQGYQKFRTRAFQVVRGEGNLIVLPNSLVEELATLPSTVASPHGALEHDLLGSYTGLDVILESRLHHSIVQRRLTPRLGLITPRLEKELIPLFEELLPPSKGEWIEFQPYQVFCQLAARLTAHAIVGPAFCNDPVWLDIAINYTENLFKTIVVLRLLPSWTHSVVSRLLPSYWKCQGYIRSSKVLLGPKIRELLGRSEDGSLAPDSNEDEFNVLTWLAFLAKGSERKPDNIAHTEVLLSLASIHTTLLRMLNVLYDLTAHPELLEELRVEIYQVASSPEGWNKPYDRLYKLDSVLRESQRMSPPSTIGIKRLFKTPYTFQNGLHIPKGTYVCMPVYAIENDPEHTPNPDLYDGLRSYRAYMQSQSTPGNSNNSKEFQFSYANDPNVLNFGYGKYACPGRFFASLIIKMVLAKLLVEYDFQFLPGTGRPANLEVHEFLFSWPWNKMLLRRREGSTFSF
ncbi:putative cytochrome P450 [Daldinia vernicosa]|uniref:putative cytochrome P450 n=1 Tax=Daldinia vernicosa TaxID=114800 RepID=UPI002008C7A6|nr:putative cytochrome P450 [Daldinia vernicosa]KAI0847851.1 putative cytochrome P450 [Daldinia vernicosa]